MSNRTAMHVEAPSNATRKLVEFMEFKTPFPTILDYGAGNGRNAYYISSQTPAFVLAYDPYAHKKPLFPIINSPVGFKDVPFMKLHVVCVDYSSEWICVTTKNKI